MSFRKRVFFMILCISILLVPVVESSMFWVSTSGSDSNGCNNSSTPLTTTAKATISGGIDCITAAGDVVKVRDGTYTSNVDWAAASGSSGNPVILQAETPRQVVWNTTGAQNIRIAAKNWITVRGFIIDGTNGNWGSGQQGEYTALTVTGAERNINVTGGATNIKFENNEIRQTAYGFAFVAGDTANVAFSGNWIHHHCKVRN